MTSDEVTFAITRRDALRRAGLAASLPLLTLALPARAETPSGRLEMEEVEISLPLSADGDTPLSTRGPTLQTQGAGRRRPGCLQA